jgi:YggT family protein
MRPLIQILLFALDMYGNLVVASAILSWLIAFNVVNTRNDLVRAIAMGLYQITEPVLRPIRRFLPNMGTMDISPIVLLLLIWLVGAEIRTYILPNVF